MTHHLGVSSVPGRSPEGDEVSRELCVALKELGVWLAGGKSSRSPFPPLKREGGCDGGQATLLFIIRSMKIDKWKGQV